MKVVEGVWYVVLVDWLTSQLEDLPALLVILLGGGATFVERALGLGSVAPTEALVCVLAAVTTSWPTQALLFVAVTVGATAGDLVAYLAGRRWGPRVQESRLFRRVGAERWERMAGAVRERGAVAVYFTRLIPVMRMITPAAAGAVGLRPGPFLLATLAGSATWTAIYVGIGLLAREPAALLYDQLGGASWLVLGTVVVVAIAALAIRNGLDRRSLALSNDDGTEPDNDQDPLLQQLFGQDNWKTVPNLISVSRLALLPVVIVLLARHSYLAGGILLVVVFATDGIDGALARRTGAVSALGTWLDPVADRLTALAVMIAFAVGQIVPVQVLLLMIIPDLLLGLMALVVFKGSPQLPVTKIAKVRTAALFVGMSALLLGVALPTSPVADVFLSGGTTLLLLGLVGHFLAASQYARAMLARWQTRVLETGRSAPSRG